MTQTQLADFAQLSKGYIVKIEHGEANITFGVAYKLKKILKCSWQDIIRGLP